MITIPSSTISKYLSFKIVSLGPIDRERQLFVKGGGYENACRPYLSPSPLYRPRALLSRVHMHKIVLCVRRRNYYMWVLYTDGEAVTLRISPMQHAASVLRRQITHILTYFNIGGGNISSFTFSANGVIGGWPVSAMLWYNYLQHRTFGIRFKRGRLE